MRTSVKVGLAVIAVCAGLAAVAIVIAPYDTGQRTREGNPVTYRDYEVTLYPTIRSFAEAFLVYPRNPAVGLYLHDARTAVLERLTDPASAQFQHVVARRLGNGTRFVFCGEVNSKNQWGGYTGFRAFAASSQAAILAEDGESKALDECSDPANAVLTDVSF